MEEGTMDTPQRRDAAYVLGHADKELQRLTMQSRLFEPFTAQLFRDAGLAPGMRVLDVGSGSGDVAFLAARMVGPSGQVVGLDRSAVAVATASRRALARELSNTRFVVGDVSTMTFAEPFDAVVGRFVLLFCPEPVAVLRQVVGHVRVGGVIVFQEPDWAGCRSAPESLLWTRCVDWCDEAFRRSGADPYLGVKLFATFTAAGLPPPALYLHAGIAAGRDHPLYAVVAETVRTLLPTMEQLGIATADEVDVDTLAERISNEVAGAQGTVTWFSLIGATARKLA
jgi:SAM-dependent methyltransferase